MLSQYLNVSIKRAGDLLKKLHTIQLWAALFSAMFFLSACATLQQNPTTETSIQPDPKLLHASKEDLALEISKSCLIAQLTYNRANFGDILKPCNCYAEHLVRVLSPSELAFFRTNGYFNPTAKQQAISQMRMCALDIPSVYND